MLTNKKLTMGMGALAMLLNQTNSVNLEKCCGDDNNVDINIKFQVNAGDGAVDIAQ